MRLTGLLFSCCGMSSGFGRGGGLGLVRENSCGLVVLIGAFLTWPPRDTASASCFMRISISGRHLKNKQTHPFVPFYLWNNNTLPQKIFPTSAEGQSSFSPHIQHRRWYSTLLVSTWWGLWRRNSGTTGHSNGAIDRWLFPIQPQAFTLIRWKVSYCLHPLDVQWFDNVAEMLKSKVIEGKRSEVTDNWWTI